MPGASLEDARAWLKRGAAVLPLPFRSKVPTIQRWQDLRLTDAELAEHFNAEPRNIGVLLGKPSGDLVDVDLDWREAAIIAAMLLPPTAVFGRASSLSSHRLYLAAGIVTQKWQLPFGDDRVVLELRSTGAQTVVPPSMHPSGEDVRWERQVKPARIDGAALEQRCALIASAAVLARLTWRSGSRHELVLAIAGAMLGSGWSEDDVAALIEAASQAAGDLELADRLAAVRTTAEALKAGQQATGLPTLARLVGEELVGVLKRWLHLGDPLHGIRIGGGSSDWPVGGEDAELVIVPGSAVRMEPVSWLWPNRIARGALNMIGGDPGLSKSTVSCDIAARCTVGGAWPMDSTSCEPGAVLLLNVEDSKEQTVVPRLVAASADMSQVHIIDGVRSANGKQRVMTLADVALLENHLRRAERQYALLVCDPVSALMAGRDSHKDADVRGLLAPLADIAMRYALAVLLVAHLNKAQGMHALYRVGGSIAFVASVRMMHLLVQDPDDRDRLLLLPAKSNLATHRMAGLSYHLVSTDLGSGVVAPRVVWHDVPEMRTADEVLNPKRPDQEAPDRAAAETWLLERLANGPVLVRGLQEEATLKVEASWRTIERAARQLGIIGRGEKKARTWGLPRQSDKQNDKPSPTSEETVDGKPEKAEQTVNLPPLVGDGLSVSPDLVGKPLVDGSSDEPALDADVL